MVYEAIKGLVEYGLKAGLITEADRIYATNQILDVMKMDEYEGPQGEVESDNLELILKELLDAAHENGALPEDSITYRDLFDTRLMNCLMPRPSQVVDEFWKHYSNSPEEATDYYYKLSQDSDYIRRYRVCKDMKWKTATPYGDLDITVNLSKPEKDPKAIAAAKLAKQSGYPKCLQDVPTIRPEITTESFPLPSMIPSGDSSTLLMYITMNTVSYLMVSTSR